MSEPIEGVVNLGTEMECRARRWSDGDIELYDGNDGTWILVWRHNRPPFEPLPKEAK